jgi:general nucleoside transport system permease protein
LEFLSELFTASLIRSTLRISSPIIWVAMGCCISHRAGVFNFAVEGLMLFGAFFAVFFTFYANSTFMVLVLTVFAVVLISYIFALVVLELNADPVITAFGVNLLGIGGTAYLMKTLLGETGGVYAAFKLTRYKFEWLTDFAFANSAFNKHTILTFLSLLLLPAVTYLLYRTVFGINLRASGEDPEAATAAGINVKRYKYAALCICGAFCAIGGADMSLGFLSMFSENMTVGRGIMAFAAALFGRNYPIPVFFTALFFGFADAFCNRLQGYDVPTDFILTLPYLLTVIVLALSSSQIWRYFKKRKNIEESLS